MRESIRKLGKNWKMDKYLFKLVSKCVQRLVQIYNFIASDQKVLFFVNPGNSDYNYSLLFYF